MYNIVSDIPRRFRKWCQPTLVGDQQERPLSSGGYGIVVHKNNSYSVILERQPARKPSSLLARGILGGSFQGGLAAS